MHITDDLLEVRGGHRDDARELHRRDGERIDIQLNQIEREMRDHLLLTVQDLNAQLGGVRLLHVEHDALIVGHRLHELEQIDHVDAEHVLLWAVELIKAIALEAEVHQNRVRAVHCHDLHAGTVKLQIGIRQDILDGFNQRPEGCGLDGADAEEHVCVRVHSTVGWVVRV